MGLISRDPAEDDQNLYRYVKNNPINQEDPSGLQGGSGDALEIVDEILTGGIITLKFFGGIAHGVFRNEIVGTVEGALEMGAASRQTLSKSFSFFWSAAYGYYTGNTDATRQAEDTIIGDAKKAQRVQEYFENAGPTLQALYSDFSPGGVADGLEPETEAFLVAIKPELEVMAAVLVNNVKNAPKEDIAWNLGEIVATILFAAATAGVGMAAQFGKNAAKAAKLQKLMNKWGLSEAEAKKMLDAVASIFNKLENAPRSATSYGSNALGHFRSHSQHIRTTARKLGIEIPKGPTKPGTQAAMKSFIDKVVQEGDKKTGKFKDVVDAEWYKLGDAIVVRRPNGEWVSFLDYSVKSPLSNLWDSM